MITRTLARFAARTSYEEIPQKTREIAKIELLDSIGCGLYGADTQPAKAVQRLVQEQGGKPESTLWAAGFRGPAANVAMALGTMVHAYELDDYHPAKLHPGSVVVPTVITMAERQKCNGRELLTALVVGSEIMARVSLGTGPLSSRRRGWHLTGTCGTFGAAAAATKLMGLDEEGVANALGLAGTQSSGLWAFLADGSASKRFHPGRAAQSGIIAAQLAANGLKGPTAILEAPDGGFCKATSDEFSLERIIEGLGKTFELERLYFKPHSCCGSLQSTIDCVLGLRHQNSPGPRLVREILIGNSEGVLLQCGWDYEPKDVLQAQMSAQYCVAIALLEGQLLPDQFRRERLADPEVLGLAKRVRMVVDPEINALYPERWPSKVKIMMQDGREFYRSVDDPKGSPGHSLTRDEIMEKFLALGRKARSESALREIAELVFGIDRLQDLSPLFAHLV